MLSRPQEGKGGSGAPKAGREAETGNSAEETRHNGGFWRIEKHGF